jgi:hypothetical protein
MSRPRATWGQALKDIAVRVAREAERYVGAQSDAPCSGCVHVRSEHCGCGTVCLGPTDGGTARCECQGFASKETHVG